MVLGASREARETAPDRVSRILRPSLVSRTALPRVNAARYVWRAFDKQGIAMGEFLDRGQQRKLLLELRDDHPHPKHYALKGDEAGRREAVNLHYLIEHGLVEGKLEFSGTGDRSARCRARLTHKGLDFLADDGGLGAILGVVTVKLHDDTIRDLLMARVDADAAKDDTAKAKLKDTIRGLPAEMLSTVVKKAMEIGLGHVGDIGTWIHHVANAAA